MKNAKHTPGPWGIKKPTDFIGPFQHVVDRSGWIVCNVNNTNEPKFQDEREANARLIAAAPIMFEVLERVAEYFDTDCIAIDAETKVDCIHCAVKDALKKATGGSNE